MEYWDLAEQLLKKVMQISAQPIQRNTGKFVCGEMFALGRLDHGGPATPGELARTSGTTTAHVAKMLRSLEAKGDIRRDADPEDGRRVLVSITEAGRKRLRDRAEEVHRQTAQLLEALGEDDAREFVRLLSRVAALSSGAEG